jgi:TatD DNase family protein
MLVDTHAHVHFEDYKDDLDVIFQNARDNGVGHVVCVGTDEQDSHRALDFVSDELVSKQAAGVTLSATIGLHPHEANRGDEALKAIEFLLQIGEPIAIGECGLDYYRNLSTKDEQMHALEFQVELALKHDLPLVFHVRDAWDDFFSTVQKHPGLRGVIHSFTGGPHEVERAAKHDLYFGLNGIMTFTSDEAQLEAARLVPADKLLLETDCPFLTPAPLRGKRNEPANVALVARFLAELRGVDYMDLVETTSNNFKKLFAT